MAKSKLTVGSKQSAFGVVKSLKHGRIISLKLQGAPSQIHLSEATNPYLTPANLPKKTMADLIGQLLNSTLHEIAIKVLNNPSRVTLTRTQAIALIMMLKNNLNPYMIELKAALLKAL
jgi:hypothetical protein